MHVSATKCHTQLSKHGYFGKAKRPPIVLEQLDKPVEFVLREWSWCF